MRAPTASDYAMHRPRFNKSSGEGSGRPPRPVAPIAEVVIANHLRQIADLYESGRVSWTDLDPFGSGLLEDLNAWVHYKIDGFGAVGYTGRVYRTFALHAGFDGETLGIYRWLDDASLAGVIVALRATADTFMPAAPPSEGDGQ